jgi:hypothetical protein
MPHVFRLRRLVFALGALTSLSACGGSLDSIGSTILSGNAQSSGMNPADFAAKPTCPPVEIQAGTETMLFFDPAKPNDLTSLRYQASVQRVARECSEVGENMIVRVGAAGRIASGPKGATGNVEVPVRIAVSKGDKVLYSKLHMVPVSVQAPDYSALWSEVDEAVIIPITDSADATIYVGLDEMGLKKTPQKAKAKKQPG